MELGRTRWGGARSAGARQRHRARRLHYWSRQPGAAGDAHAADRSHDSRQLVGAGGHSALVLLPAAFFEELFIRGYVFSVLRRTAGWRMALIVTSVVFGLLH